MSEYKPIIIEVKTQGVGRREAEAAVKAQTGAGSIFWCPDYQDGQQYDGHAHVSPPAGASSASSSPINLRGSKR